MSKETIITEQVTKIQVLETIVEEVPTNTDTETPKTDVSTEVLTDSEKQEIVEQEKVEEVEVIVCDAFTMELKRCIKSDYKGELRLNQSKAGSIFMDQYKFIKNDKFFYKFNDDIGIWEKTNTKQLESLVTKDLYKLCDFWHSTDVNQTSKFIENMVNGNIEGDTFDKIFNKDPYSIVFKNGTLNLRNGDFEPIFHTYDYNTVRIPHNYNSEAGTPIKTINFLSMITNDITELNFIFAWMGYLMVKGYTIQKMLFLNGDGGNGKSTLIKLMTAVVGEENTSAVSMKSLINDKHSGASLYNKLFNTVADIGADFFDDASILKGLTGDDVVNVEFKYDNAFPYKNFAKMTYSANRLPKFKDTSGGLERRLLVLDLNQEFTTMVKDSGIHINDILNDVEEMERVVAYSVANFMEVMQNNFNFTESESMLKAKSDWLNDDPIVDFMKETFEFTGDKADSVPMKDFMKIYKAWCTDRGYKAMSQKNVIEAIKINSELTKNGINISRESSKTFTYKITGVFSTMDELTKDMWELL